VPVGTSPLGIVAVIREPGQGVAGLCGCRPGRRYLPAVLLAQATL
jgi:hypothetical protein